MIRAAGGLLWDDARRIALVHRRRYNDWTLPKGKLHEGESWEQAALREVAEETGYPVKRDSFAGAVAYETPKGGKVVRFWNMSLTNGARTPIDADEVAEVVWLTAEAACDALTYALERALVAAAAGIDR